MKPDVIERLLMDRALGHLDPDVDTLLGEHLANDTSAASQARELQDLVHLAGEAVRQPSFAVAPPNQIRRLIWRHRAEQALAIAASLAVGAGICFFALRSSMRHEDRSLASTAQTVPTTSRRGALVNRKIESLPFWSNQRLYLLASASAADANAKEMVK